jgi:hypothetical protein
MMSGSKRAKNKKKRMGIISWNEYHQAKKKKKREREKETWKAWRRN